MNPLRIFLLAALILVVFNSTEVDAEKKEPLWNYTTEDEMQQMAISANGEYIVTGSDANKVSFFDKDISNPLWFSYTQYKSEQVRSVAISANGEYTAAGCDDNKVWLRDGIETLWTYETGDWVWSVDISADGEYIVAGSWDYKVYLFDKDSNTPLWNYDIGDRVESVAISADGEYIVAVSFDDNVFFFHKNSSTPLWNYETGSDVHSVSISADGEYIVIGTGSFHPTGWTDDNKVYLFNKDGSTPNATTVKELWNYTAGDPVYSVAISADGEYIAAGSYDENVYLFGKDSNTPLWNYTAGNPVISVAISADGKYITASSAYGRGENKTYLFDKDSSTPLWNYTTGDWVTTVAISADGEYIAAIAPIIDTGDWGTSVSTLYLFDKSVPPTATIDSITPSPARFDANVTFNGTGSDRDGTIVAYEWTSDLDGFLSDDDDFSITGFSVGTHTISFRVQDNDGQWSEWDTAKLEIYPNAPPVAGKPSLSSPSTYWYYEDGRSILAEKGSTVFFSGTGADTDGTIVAYQWKSSIDGVLNVEAHFSSSTLSSGPHTITFQVQDNDGEWSNETSESLLVFILPVASASHWNDESNEIKLGGAAHFRGTGSDEDGRVVKYEWDFNGDGDYEYSSSFNGDTSYTYNFEGTYTAVLRVTDDDGFTATDSRVITVSEEEEEDESSLPSVSMIPVLISIGLLAIFRRK